MASRGRKDAFPGADGSNLSTTIPIYGADGNTLTEGATGLKQVDITTAGVLSGNTSPVYAVKNPLTFIYNTTAPHDWYTNNSTYQDNTLWGDEDIKSTYDPCPKDWQIPQNGTWADFSISTAPYYIQGMQTTSGSRYASNGICYFSHTWYPAAGYRYYRTGELYSVGYDGCNWTSSIHITNAIYLYFLMENVYANSYTSQVRSQGYSIRCVQE